MTEPLIASSSPESTDAFSEAITTIDAIAQCVRKKLDDYPDVDWLTASLTDSGTSISVNDPSKWAIGTVWEADDATGEQIYVSANGANPLTIRRGWEGTTSYPHASNAVFRRRPRFSDAQVRAAISGVISAELWPWIYNVRRFLITPSASTIWYAVPDDFGEPISMFQKGTGSITDFTNFRPPVPGFVSTDVSANGRAVNLTSTSYHLTDPSTHQINYLYAAKVTDTTIPAKGGDCICWGTAARLQDAKTIPVSMPDSDRATQEVRASDRARSAVFLRNRFEDTRNMWRIDLLKKARPARQWRG
jgi:hypothetical protein